MRRIVITADDGGLDVESDESILECARAGGITAVSVGVTGPTWQALVKQLRYLDVDVGLHLNLTEGLPLAGPYRTLTKDDKRFHGDVTAFSRRLLEDRVSDTEIACEVDAQWSALAELTTPAFVNGHNHVHVLPEVAQALDDVLPTDRPWVRVPVPGPAMPAWFVDVCDDDHLEAVRMLGPSCEQFAGWAFAQTGRADAIATELGALKDAATIEWMTHPGARPGHDFARSAARGAERTFLSSPALGELLTEHELSPVRFSAL